ncbi:UPF0767 family, partial [Trinorchestia longiramus]
MWPLLMQFARTYAPYITLPVATIIGFIGYNIESHYRTQQPNRPSVEILRDERVVNKIVQETQQEGKVLPDPLNKKTFVPDSIFTKNLSPGLQKPS